MKDYKDVRFKDLETGKVHGGLFDRMKNSVASKVNDAKVFYYNNQELCNKVLIPGAISITILTTKEICKANKYRREERRRDLQVYDRKLDRRCTMKRRPTSKEWDIIARRRENHESYTSILRDMGLLKY